MGRGGQSEKLVQELMMTVGSFGESFMDVLAKDACDGHDVCKVRLSSPCILYQAQPFLFFAPGDIPPPQLNELTTFQYPPNFHSR